MKNWKELLLKSTDSIQQALRAIDAAGSQLAMVVSDEGRLLGVLTDGNIRRGLLAGYALAEPVHTVMNAAPTVVSPEMQASAALRLMQERDFSHLPVVDASGILVACWSRKGLQAETTCESPVVLMAGGLGSRLGELTANCPKPMLKVGGKPILEIILHSFIDCGFRNFFFSVNYRAEIIENYFSDGAHWGVSIRYLREEKPLGTAGALSLLPDVMAQPVVVMNGDILTRLNPRLLLEAHSARNAAATMVIRKHEMQIPYGVVRCTPEGRLAGIDEKPLLPFAISAGINVFSPEALAYIPRGSFFDIPDLFTTLLAKDKAVAVYETDEYWIDIGRESDYNQADKDFAAMLQDGCPQQ